MPVNKKKQIKESLDQLHVVQPSGLDALPAGDLKE